MRVVAITLLGVFVKITTLNLFLLSEQIATHISIYTVLQIYLFAATTFENIGATHIEASNTY